MRSFVPFLCVAALAAPAWAGFDHPELLDVNTEFSSTTNDGAEQEVDIRHSQSQNSADGFFDDETANAGADIFWTLYEPDKVGRSSNSGKQGQGSYLAIGFSTWDTGGTTWNSTLVDNCKAATSVSGSQGNPTEAKWKVSCKGALEALGVDAGQAARLEELLGRVVKANSDKINIKGRGTPAP